MWSWHPLILKVCPRSDGDQIMSIHSWRVVPDLAQWFHKKVDLKSGLLPSRIGLVHFGTLPLGIIIDNLVITTLVNAILGMYILLFWLSLLKFTILPFWACKCLSCIVNFQHVTLPIVMLKLVISIVMKSYDFEQVIHVL